MRSPRGAPRELMAELLGRETGCSRGRGGSMHLFSPEIGLMGTSGIVGPCILQACGGGYSFKLMKMPHVAVAFFGEAPSITARSTKDSTWPASGSCRCCSSARTTSSRPRCRFPTAAATPPSALAARLRPAGVRARRQRRAVDPSRRGRGRCSAARRRRPDPHRVQDIPNTSTRGRHGRFHLSNARGS